MNLRLVAIGLVVANLLVAGWWFMQAPDAEPATGRAAAAPLDAPRLALVGELSAEARKALEKPRTEGAEASEHSAESGAPAEPAGVLCVSIGPFDDSEVAGRVAGGLRSNGVVVEQREESGQLRTGYWVHLPPFPSQEAAEDAADDLKKKGAGELFIVTASEQRHAISLGLFTSAERADQRAAEIAELGYRPRIAERFREGPVFWLEYREPEALAFDVAPLLQGLDPAIQRSARACPTSPAPSP